MIKEKIIDTPEFQLIKGDSMDVMEVIPHNQIDVIFTSPDPPKDLDELDILEFIIGFNSKNILKDTGSIWVHMADFHTERGSLNQFPSRFARKMLEDGWVFRDDIIWHKIPNRPYKEDGNRWMRDYDHLMHFTKSRHGYYYKDIDSPYSISSVWNEQYNTSHALFSKSVINAILRITCPVSGTVLDPFAGSGTTGFVAQSMQLKFIGIEKNMQRCLKMKKEFDNMIVLS